jgi:hypothetical protein
MAGGAAMREYARELLVRPDGALLLRLPRERNADDLVFDNRPSS